MTEWENSGESFLSVSVSLKQTRRTLSNQAEIVEVEECEVPRKMRENQEGYDSAQGYTYRRSSQKPNVARSLAKATHSSGTSAQ